MSSLSSRFLLLLMRIPGLKRLLATPRTVRLLVSWDRRSGPARPTRRMLGRCDVSTTMFEGRTLYAVAPKGSRRPGHVLYLHGGGYVFEILAPHWRFIDDVVTRTGLAMTVPLYPLGPEAGCEEAVDFALKAYLTLIEHVPAEEVTVMGDSAGGGLALVLSQRLAALGHRQPGRLVLLSPWLDLTMTNPGIAPVEPRDPYLTVAAALEAARLYAGPERLADPLASPLRGPLRGLPPITVVGGTDDILAPDARRLRDLVTEAGGRIELLEYEGMMHAFMFFPIREADEAVARIAGELAREARLEAVA